MISLPTSSQNQPAPATLTGQFCRVQDAARFLSVSASTIRLLCDTGDIHSTRSPGGHRLIQVDGANGIKAYAYGTTGNEDEAKEKVIAIYERVSSCSQDQAGSLDRQHDRLMKEVSEREGIPQSSIIVFKDVASSFGNRPGLNRLCDAIISKRISEVYCEYQDRLSRVPSTTSLVEYLAKRSGVEIICLDMEETDADDMAAGLKELLDFAQILNARQAGRKSAKICRKEFKPETVTRAWALRREGLTLKAIAKTLNDEGHRLTKLDGTEHPVTYNPLKDRIFTQEATQVANVADGKSGADIGEWLKSNLKPCPGNKVSIKDICNRYREHAKQIGVEVAAKDWHLARQIEGERRYYQTRQDGKQVGQMMVLNVAFSEEQVKSSNVVTVDSVAEYLNRSVLKADAKERVTSKQVWPVYVKWCKANSIQPETKRALANELSKRCSSSHISGGYRQFKGLRLVG